MRTVVTILALAVLVLVGAMALAPDSPDPALVDTMVVASDRVDEDVGAAALDVLQDTSIASLDDIGATVMPDGIDDAPAQRPTGGLTQDIRPSIYGHNTDPQRLRRPFYIGEPILTTAAAPTARNGVQARVA